MVVQCVIEVSSEHYYSCELTRKIPVRVSIVAINGNTGFGIVELLEHGEEALKTYVEQLRASSSVVSVDVTYESPKAYWTRVVHKMNGPSIHDTILKEGCMSFLPIIVERGYQIHTVLAPSRDMLSNLLHSLRKRFSRVKIRRIHSTPTVLSKEILTVKQKEAFSIAFETGYYSIPRECKIEDIASKLKIKRVAMQERLRRAELKIFAAYIDGGS